MLKSLVLLCAVGVTTSVPLHDEITPRNGEKCGYESCPDTAGDVLNVHIVPHTHDDVGWLKTVDQYYYGSKNSIQKAGVQYILDSVVKELWEDPKRRFIYVETAFFWKWWVRQSDDVRHKVHALVRQGRLQFVGGAWSMNDEAASHYQSTIDQFTWGLSKLNETFGACGLPHVGWQIDPFGHAREFASLLSAMGYDGLFLGRIDYQDKKARLEGRNMEMLWRGDDDLGKQSDIFTGILYNTYSPPPGFCFDILCDDEPIIDDADSPLFNVDEKIAIFLDYVSKQAPHYRTNNVIITMGGDFTYQDATMWYKNLDKLIEYSNLKAAKDGLNIKLFYSTPTCYLKAVRDANVTLPRKQDDFFPYASDSTAYWTGYFTSRPTTKYFEREGNVYLQMAKQIQVLAGLDRHNIFLLNELKSAMGVMQHHDAITGTEKQHVARDYERLLSQALDDSLLVARQAFNKITQKDDSRPVLFSYDRCHLNESRCYTSEHSERFIVTIYNALAWDVKEPVRIPVKDGNYEVYAPNGDKIDTQLIDIPKQVLNIPTRQSVATHEIVFIAELHALGYKSFYVKKLNKVKRDTTIKRKSDYYDNINGYWSNLKDKTLVEIKDIEGATVKFDSNIDAIKIPLEPMNAKHVNTIKDVDVEVLKDNSMSDNVEELDKLIKDVRKMFDLKQYRQRPVDDIAYPNLNDEEMRMLSDEPNIFDDVDNKHDMKFVRYPREIDDNEVSTSFYYYPACVGDNREPANRSSGAYIFRPNATKPVKLTLRDTEVKNGHIVTEERSSMKEQEVLGIRRYYKDLDFIEYEWVVGPINIDDNVGKEIVVKYQSNIMNNGEFYTDSNGRQVLKRKLNKRPQWNLTLAEPIAGNYYPVVNEIFIENGDKRMTVLTDRAQGGTSLVEGEIELMLHRRLLHDDAFGVGEALNETAYGKGLVVTGKHRILLSKTKVTEAKHILQMHLQPIVFVSDATNLEIDEWLKFRNCYSFLKEKLPEGLHLLTLEPWGKKLLIRIENYLNKSENSTVEIDLSAIFNNIRIESIKETTLSANQYLDDYKKWSWKKDGDFDESFNKKYGSFYSVPLANDIDDIIYDDGFKIKVKAKEIRTFIADYEIL